MIVETAASFSDRIRMLEDKALPYPYGEVFDEDDEVERDGYRTTEQQINELLFAGEKLRAYRSDLYTFVDGKDDGFTPSRVGDLVDAQRLADAIKARQDRKIELAAEAARKKKEEDDERAKKDGEELATYRAKAAKETDSPVK